MSFLQDNSDNRVPRDDDNWAFNQLAAKLRNVKIRARHTGNSYSFDGFTHQSSDNIAFDSDEGKVPISGYFARSYGIRLKQGNYLCVKAHPERDIYITLKLCMVRERQRLLELPAPEQMSTMVRSARTRLIKYLKPAMNTMRMMYHNRQ